MSDNENTLAVEKDELLARLRRISGSRIQINRGSRRDYSAGGLLVLATKSIRPLDRIEDLLPPRLKSRGLDQGCRT